MRFFSGFTFQNEQIFFKQFLNSSQFNVAGFSYGSILAFEYVLNSDKRIDSLQLFSPAFFQDSSEKFIRLQLLHFKKDKEKYIDNFTKNTFFPNAVSNNFERGKSEYDELEKLLRYRWKESDLQKIVDRNIKIEIFLGGKDKIINSQTASNFFKQFGEICFIKDVGHILN